MKTLITLLAHYDGKAIVLDTPFNLKPDERLLVTILDSENTGEEWKNWNASSLAHLNNAYGTDEPDYSIELIKEPNRNYKK